MGVIRGRVLEEIQFPGAYDCLGAAAGVELTIQVPDVRLEGILFHYQLLHDLLI